MRVRRTVRWGFTASIVCCLLMTQWGCRDEMSDVRKIQRRREQQQQVGDANEVAEAFNFVSQLGEVDATAASERISSLLNSWLETQAKDSGWQPPALLATLGPELMQYPPLQQLALEQFINRDSEYLQLNYLLKSIGEWTSSAGATDPLFAAWIDGQEERLGVDGQGKLREAVRLFDWTTRNIQLAPLEETGPGPSGPRFPFGMVFRGPGYRQTTLQTLYRGEGDRLQRARVFIQLCRQAGIDACMLVRSGQDAPEDHWAVGVLIGKELFLFEPGFGLPIPGPNQQGIATLAEAKKDPSVLNRLRVVGWFEYEFTNADIASSDALLDVEPEAMSMRMQQLQKGLTGANRLVLGYDVDQVAESFKAINGIDEARLWPLSIQARIYEDVLNEAAMVDQQIAAWKAYQWGMLSGTFPLAQARWHHLRGRLNKEEEKAGAKVEYQELLLLEDDIEKLRNNVELQQRYGVRRELGMEQNEYDFRIQQIQHFMVMAKRAATNWLSLIQYDTGEFESARNWFEKRVLVEDRESAWKPSARYNLARTLEQLGQTEQAVELYKTIGDPQEHGNRLRARLLQRESE